MRTTFKLDDGERICQLDFPNVRDEEEALRRVNEARLVASNEPPDTLEAAIAALQKDAAERSVST